ncbi:MAG TPA: hypothetical protein VHB20_19010 [Verrucomicrobiae bacterium]|nr:hypothetical protein [Verrucomicrobiae bacterium]
MVNDAASDGGSFGETCSPELEAAATVRFRLLQRGDFIRPGLWHWRCRREDGFDNVAYGYVQADHLGNVISAETFEDDWACSRRK